MKICTILFAQLPFFSSDELKQTSHCIKWYIDDTTLITWNLVSYIESERPEDDGREMTTSTTTTRTTQKVYRRGRQSGTMDFEECNFRRHTTIAIPVYLPRRIISSSARAVLIFRASWESSRLGKARSLVLVAIEKPSFSQFLEILVSCEFRIVILQQWSLCPAAHETLKSNDMHFLFPKNSK